MLLFEISGGEGGIRTLGTGVSPYNGLANRRIRPLCHLSGGPATSLTWLYGQGLLSNRALGLACIPSMQTHLYLMDFAQAVADHPRTHRKTPKNLGEALYF